MRPAGVSLRKLAAEAAASGVVDVSDVALLMRFRRCGDWLIALCENLLARRDASAGGRGAQESGSASSTARVSRDPGRTCFRLHLCYDVAGQRIADFAVTPLDKGETLDRVGVQPGDIAIADRGYPQPDGMRATRDAGADLLVRLTWNTPRPARRRGRARQIGSPCSPRPTPRDHFDMPVTVHKARGRFRPLPMRLVITPKPPDIAERARDVARQQRPQGSTRRRPAHLEEPPDT